MRILLVLLAFSLLISGCASGTTASGSTGSGATPSVMAASTATAPAAAAILQTPTSTALALVPTVQIPTATQPLPTASATTGPTATSSPTATTAPAPTATAIATATTPANTPTAAPTGTSVADSQPTSAATPDDQGAEIPQTGASGVPQFDHIIVIVFENHNYSEIIGNNNLTIFNRLAQQNVLLTQYHAVAHPSLPNYIAMTGGSTFGITNDCTGCFLDQPNLADWIEASGRTWKTYQESMTKPCALGIQQGGYDQNHDPFVYFDDIRGDPTRCQQSVVPLTQLTTDLNANQLPNFAFIMPNLCSSAHSCALTSADRWLGNMVDTLQASPALGKNYLIFITFDEASADNSTCCGMPAKAGGLVPAILISPLANAPFQDATPLSHYSLLKTILLSWNLPDLGNTANPLTVPITAPWK